MQTRLHIALVPCLSDNYCVLLHAPEDGATVAIDAPDAVAIEKALDDRGWSLSGVVPYASPHRPHRGVAAFKARFGCQVTGPAGELSASARWTGRSMRKAR